MGEWDYVWSINGQEVFEMNHNQICNLVKGSGNQLQMVIERGDHIVPNFEEIWPSDKNKDDKYKRRLIGMEYYMDAMENHGLKGHLRQAWHRDQPVQLPHRVLRRGRDRGDDGG